jgi:hypothetical protein
MEGIEEAVDRLDQRLAAMSSSALDERLAGLEAQLAKLSADVTALAAALDAGPAPVPREQERLKVDDAAPAPKRRAASRKKS